MDALYYVLFDPATLFCLWACEPAEAQSLRQPSQIRATIRILGEVAEYMTTLPHEGHAEDLRKRLELDNYRR